MPKTRSTEPTIISFYSHKGGVGKTTAIHNIAYILSEELKYKVLLIDADPQCSLTGLVMNDVLHDPKTPYQDVYQYLDENRDTCANIYDAFAFLTEEGTASNSIDEILETKAKEIRKKLYTPKYAKDHNGHRTPSRNLTFLPGHRDFYKLNREATYAYRNNLKAYSYVKLVFRKLFVEITKKVKNSEFDIILIDLNPGATRLNQILLMSSDYFVIPVMPDHFSKLSLTTLTKIFTNWISDQDVDQKLPKFLGVITQRVSIRSKQPVYADQNWLDLIYNVEGSFIKKLNQHRMIAENFTQYKVFIKSFSTLGLDAQNHSMPVVGISDSESDSDIASQFREAVYNILFNMTKEDKRDLQFYSEGHEIVINDAEIERKRFIEKNQTFLEGKSINFDWDFGNNKFPYVTDNKLLQIYFSAKSKVAEFKQAAAKQVIFMVENGLTIKSERTFYGQYVEYVDQLWDILKSLVSDLSEYTQSPGQHPLTLDSLQSLKNITLIELAQFIDLMNTDYKCHYDSILHVLKLVKEANLLRREDLQKLKNLNLQYENSKTNLIKKFEKSSSEKLYKKFIIEIFSNSVNNAEIVFKIDDDKTSLLYLLLVDLNVHLQILDVESDECIELNKNGQIQLQVMRHGASFGFERDKSRDSTPPNSAVRPGDTLTPQQMWDELLKQKFSPTMQREWTQQSGEKDYLEKRWKKSSNQSPALQVNPSSQGEQPVRRAKIIANFNHKGGVGKTTTTYHLAVQYASQNKRVLIVDADPQCNLSSMAMQKDFEIFSDSSGPFDRRNRFNFYSLLYYVYLDDETRIEEIVENAELYNSERYNNLFLLPAKFDELSTDVEIYIANLLSSSELSPGLKKTHQLNKIFQDIARKFDIDIILLDLSPSISYVNQLVLMNSDYFLVPFFPDYQSQQAIISLSTLLPYWFSEMKKICDGINEKEKKLPRLSFLNNAPMQNNQLQILQPKLLHIIPQRYPLKRKSEPFEIVKPAQDKINEIYEVANKILRPALEAIGMWNPSRKSLVQLRGIPNFNSRGITAQMTGHTVIDVPAKQLKVSGSANKSEKDFYANLINELVEEINKMIEFYERAEDHIPAPIPNPGVAVGVFSPSLKRRDTGESHDAKKQKLAHNHESHSDSDDFYPDPDPKTPHLGGLSDKDLEDDFSRNFNSFS